MLIIVKIMGQPVDAIPIIVYDRIDNSRARYSTTMSLFAAEMRYLHDNVFHVMSMTDLIKDNAKDSFYLTNKYKVPNFLCHY